MKGIPGYRFVPPSEVFANDTVNPANAGFCVPAGNCLGSGILNVSVCKQGGTWPWCLGHFLELLFLFQSCFFSLSLWYYFDCVCRSSHNNVLTTLLPGGWEICQRCVWYESQKGAPWDCHWHQPSKWLLFFSHPVSIILYIIPTGHLTKHYRSSVIHPSSNRICLYVSGLKNVWFFFDGLAFLLS